MHCIGGHNFLQYNSYYGYMDNNFMRYKEENNGSVSKFIC